MCSDYNVVVQSDIEHIRERPAMYVGTLEVNAMLRQVLELSVRNPYWGTIQLTIGADHSVCMHFDQPELLVAPQLESDRAESSLIALLDQAEHQIPRRAYWTGGGAPLMRSVVWVALGVQASIELSIANVIYEQSYSQGHPTAAPRISSVCQNTGHKVKCYPDDAIFPKFDVKPESLMAWYTTLPETRPESVIIDERTGHLYKLLKGDAQRNEGSK